MDLWGIDLFIWLAIAAIVAMGLAFLPKAKLRFKLVAIWTLLPAAFFLGAWLFTALNNPKALGAAFGFYMAFIVFTLPPWAAASALSYRVVRLIREPRIAGAE